MAKAKANRKTKNPQPKKAPVGVLLQNLKADVDALRIAHASQSQAELRQLGAKLDGIAATLEEIIARS